MSAWLRCVDHASPEEYYLLSVAHAVTIRRVEGGWWRAVDVLGKVHDISSDDDAKVDALMNGLPAT